MTVTNDVKPKRSVFSTFHKTAHTPSAYKSLWARRNHTVEKADSFTKVGAAAGSVAGTLLPLIYFAKKQNGLKKFFDIFKVKYGIPEIIAISTTSIAGGVAGGIISDRKTSKKRKINEGVFQFMNAAVPTLIVGGLLSVMDMTKKYKESKIAKVVAIVAGLGAGMPLAAKLSNIINDPDDKEPDRKLTLKDSVVNLDDALGALVVAKIPVIQHMQVEKVIPAVFAWCGYRAGQSN